MTMQRYRKKPVEVEAVQFAGGAAAATPIINWMLRHDCAATWSEAYDAWESDDGTMGHPGELEGITIQTLAGDMHVGAGDWIIRGIKGEFYLCEPDIFEATYEAVS
jgi:hypothetical protein